MDKLNTFTSTGFKFLRQATQDASLLVRPRPLSLQVALTERCNLNCSFCSVVNREKKYEFSQQELIDATMAFVNLGVKTVEITGGGEPTLYEGFEWYVDFCDSLGLKVGLITNGTLLHKVNKEILDKLAWLRISMNCLDYGAVPYIPVIKGTLGFSYVFGKDSSEYVLVLINEMAKLNRGSYVRVVPNCMCTEEQLKQQHEYLSPLVEKIGAPAFYQNKNFGHSNNCYWCRYKPFLYCDGNVYPCSSVVLNPDADKSFAQSYALCKWQDVESVLYSSGLYRVLVDTHRCSHCVFTGQNQLIESLLLPVEHEQFI